jgi:capsular polysaccharide biosynthesis protein
MENLASVLVAFITGVIGPIAVLYIKHILDKRKKKPDMVMDTLRVMN